jgi:transcriptional regulator of acetoin/glycerol metabolism
MTTATIEKHKILLSHLGEDKIVDLYNLYGNERISFATIISLIKHEKIMLELRNKVSIGKVAKKLSIQRSTVYRQIKKVAAFKKLQQGEGL